MPSVADDLLQSLIKLGDDLHRTDVRAYPSKSFRKGVKAEPLEPFKEILLAVAPHGRLAQTVWDEAFNGLDAHNKGALSRLCVRRGISFETYRRETVLSMRVMVSHTYKKWAGFKKAVALGQEVRSHPLWLRSIYDALRDDEGGTVVEEDVAAEPADQDSEVAETSAGPRRQVRGVACFPGLSLSTEAMQDCIGLKKRRRIRFCFGGGL